MPSGQPTVSAVITTHNPDPEFLVRTLDGLADQDYPIEEVVIADSSDPPVTAKVDGIPTRIVRPPARGIATGRREALTNASSDYVLELDEDAVLLKPDYVSRAVEILESKQGASAAGGVVLPMRDNREGHAIALLDRYNPSDLGTHNMVFPRAACEGGEGDICYPMGHRGEDVTLRDRLRQFGRIERMDDQPILKDLPTTRQRAGRNTVLWSLLGGVLSSVATSIITPLVKRVLARASRRTLGRDVINEGLLPA